MNALRCGLVLAALSIIFGAFGAHALRDTLAASGHTEHWKTAVAYQFMAVPGLLLLGFVRAPRWIAWFLALGAAFFSGSLYWLSLGGPGWLGPLTPLGGVLLIVGYIALACTARRDPETMG
jgi:uncharacterized membrane protein YgdD (TMEM256/DUF423 family)